MEHTTENGRGCCTSCAGYGTDSAGPCWDCRGTGCAHPEPLCAREVWDESVAPGGYRRHPDPGRGPVSAELLRKAAALMRERAEASRQELWIQNGRNGIHTPIGQCIATTHSHNDDTRKAEAEHIASWHPAVALAVAAWFDATADGLDGRGVTARVKPAEHSALAAARAYLGTTS